MRASFVAASLVRASFVAASLVMRGRPSSVRLALATLLALFSAASVWGQTVSLPTALVYDSAGNLFFTDANRNQVFEVALSGVVTVVAGNGTQGFAGDGGPAAGAELNTPSGIAVADDGTLFLSDSGNNRIRSIANGVITTIAGQGERGFGGDGGLATAATLNTPTAITVGAGGTLYLCDTGNHRVRSLVQGVISTVAGKGTQGFSGDTLQAVVAELDSPQGVAVLADGSLVLSDTHNNRIRAISTAGVIRTIAGTGIAGASGDGKPATAAELSRPMGLAADSSGNLYVADENSQRIRLIAANGSISTFAGSGVQGYSADGAVAPSVRINSPNAVGLSPFGALGFTDAQNGLVRAVISGGVLVTLAPAAVSRTSTVSLVVAAATTYGQGTALVNVTGAASPAGTVTLLDGASQLAASGLVRGSAGFSLAGLNAGSHQLIAIYGGDGVDPAARSAASVVSVQPAPVVATAASPAIEYGQAIPVLRGTATGVLPQDLPQVTVSFQTTATASSPVGSYPITASLGGAASGNYALAAGSAGVLQIAKAPSAVALQGTALQSYAGLPVVLTANVVSTTTGLPSGSVSFLDNGIVVASSVVVNGIASGSYAPSGSATHSLTAIYGGDGNFYASSSSPAVLVVAAMPDFNLAAPSPDQSVQGGLIAVFPLSLAAVTAPFTGSVSFSVKGLPAGASASFSPTTVVPGAGTVVVTMNVQTVALARLERHAGATNLVVLALLFPVGLILSGRRKTRPGFAWLAVLMSAVFVACSGCGARTVSDGTRVNQLSQLTVTATSTNLAGSIVSHTVEVSLTVQ